MDIKIVSSGVDTLIVGFMIDSYLEVAEFEVLVEAKQKAGEKVFNSKGYPVTWFGTDFVIKPSGGSGYEWILRNADVMVRIAKEARGGSVFPEVFVTFSSQFLWAEGMDGSMGKIMKWLSNWAVVSGTKASRCDLCVDLAMPFPELDINKEVVSRAKGKIIFTEPINRHVSGRRDTGYQIGKGELIARIYDKTNEIMAHQKEWFRAYWLNRGWDGETPVMRAEFQCRRNFLKRMSVDTCEDLKERMPDIWRYCTHEWLKICNPGSKTNQSRWEVKEFWKMIQDSFSLFGQEWGVLPYKVKYFKYDHLMQQTRGCLISACAVIASGRGIAEAMFKIREDLRDAIKAEDFRMDVIARQALVGNMKKPDTRLVDAVVELGAEISSVDFG